MKIVLAVAFLALMSAVASAQTPASSFDLTGLTGPETDLIYATLQRVERPQEGVNVDDLLVKIKKQVTAENQAAQAKADAAAKDKDAK